MRIQTDRQASAGGGDIHVQSWLPAATPRGVVVLVHGLAEHCGRYAELVGRLHARGLAVYPHPRRLQACARGDHSMAQRKGQP